ASTAWGSRRLAIIRPLSFRPGLETSLFVPSGRKSAPTDLDPPSRKKPGPGLAEFGERDLERARLAFALLPLHQDRALVGALHHLLVGDQQAHRALHAQEAVGGDGHH